MFSALTIQFAKWPISGRVKTRIAKQKGDEYALGLHLSLMNDVYLTCREHCSDFRLYWAERSDQSLLGVSDFWGPVFDQVDCRDQHGSDLGERMGNALIEGLQSHKKVALVGSDCPNIDAGYLDLAFSQLDEHDVVLGPAEDGGFVLVASRRYSPGIFKNVEWGTEHVLHQVLENLTACDVTFTLLDERWDVDEPEDVERWLEQGGTLFV